jgi:hypothetical protein
MQRLSAPLHGTLGSYLRDALQEGGADAVARLPVPRAYPCGVPPFCLVFFTAFIFVKKSTSKLILW